ncbi:MAG: chromate efflux transporter [Gemmatimonadaceae bacterium]|jgi:chromate transporter|nr:chromate efflux transporter [Gemmatimonadaceae bacterium]
MALPSVGSTGEIFTTFLRLGTTSFGGPIAHLAYFRHEFVERRGWLDASRYAELLALCQLLPGPASSQLGFLIGWVRGGWRGALVAFVGFTAPSALLLFALARWTLRLDGAFGLALVHGLKLVAVSIVAHAVLRMAPALAPDGRRMVIAWVSGAIMWWVSTASAQLAVLVLAGALGAMWCHAAPVGDGSPLAETVRPGTGRWALGVFALLLSAALLWPMHGAATLVALAATFVRAGALVFGGGHVVLPLLETTLVGQGWLTTDTFLAGYGAAQVVPGPLFSVSTYFGALTPTGVAPVVGAVVATLAVFAPGFLLVLAVLPVWSRVRALPRAGAVLAGVNAGVVGLLAAAWIDPVARSAVRSPLDVVIALVGIVLAMRLARPTLFVVAWCVGANVLVSFLR